MLFPSFVFDHPRAFKAITRHLVYYARGHIMEARPKGFDYDHLRLDQGIIREL